MPTEDNKEGQRSILHLELSKNLIFHFLLLFARGRYHSNPFIKGLERRSTSETHLCEKCVPSPTSALQQAEGWAFYNRPTERRRNLTGNKSRNPGHVLSKTHPFGLSLILEAQC